MLEIFSCFFPSFSSCFNGHILNTQWGLQSVLGAIIPLLLWLPFSSPIGMLQWEHTTHSPQTHQAVSHLRALSHATLTLYTTYPPALVWLLSPDFRGSQTLASEIPLVGSLFNALFQGPSPKESDSVSLAQGLGTCILTNFLGDSDVSGTWTMLWEMFISNCWKGCWLPLKRPSNSLYFLLGGSVHIFPLWFA